MTAHEPSPFPSLEVDAKAAKVDALRQLHNLESAVEEGVVGPLDYGETAWDLADTVAAYDEFEPRRDFDETEEWRAPRREMPGDD